MELRGLITWEFGESDLRSIRDHASLQRLTIKDAPRLTCLSDIDDLPDLLQLRIHAAPRLEDIDDLGGVAGSLEELWLEGCRSLRSVEAVEALTKLRVLNIGDCGSIATLAPLAALARIEVVEAWGSTEVLDGDLSPLVALPALRELRMRDRRGYRPRLASFVSDGNRIREPSGEA